MVISSQQAQDIVESADLIYSQDVIENALDTMAAEINARLAEQNPLVLCIMVGGLMPTAHLVTRFSFPAELDYIHASRYNGEMTGGDIQWLVRPRSCLKDRLILLVDDILDEGYTLKAIVDDCLQAGAREVQTAVLLDKQHGREKAIQADFKGLDVVDRYVFGFGMDYKEQLRNMPGIYAVKENG